MEYKLIFLFMCLSCQVAKIVADEMNNYLLFEHTLQIAIVPPEKIHPKLYASENVVSIKSKYLLLPFCEERKNSHRPLLWVFCLFIVKWFP